MPPTPRPWPRGAVIARRYHLVEAAPDRGVAPLWRAADVDRPEREVSVAALPPTPALAALQGERLPKSEHPDLLPPLEAGVHGDAGYVVAAWRAGVTLERWLDRHPHRRPPTRVAWRCFARLCALMESAHGAREGERAHGLLSPRSVLVGDEEAERLAVADLGLARLGASPSWRRDDGVDWTAWLAPEQVASRAARPESADVFALAVVMAELLTGHPLAVAHARVAWWQLAEEGDRAVLARLRQLRPELMGAPIDLVAQALSADPSRRFPDAGVFRKALRQAGVKTAVERAGTAVIRMPHAVDDAPARDAPTPSAVVVTAPVVTPAAAPVAAPEPPWEPDPGVTVPQEVTLQTDAFREAFASHWDDWWARVEPPAAPSLTEPLELAPPRGADLFAVEHTVTVTPRALAAPPEVDAVTTPLVRAAPPETFARTEPSTRAPLPPLPMAPRPPTLPPPTAPPRVTPHAEPAPDAPPRGALAVAAAAVALAVAALAYLLAR